ncbi:unnamed protein product [Linum tenue]|uniref:DNA/RNA-binding protein Alba-like domain-containing protein n=1 Tax=Linum tenue TaxID=586396 RepID=A0AAV0MDN6_9ROSI|nr:unnamed protein product [Linum tenue]
MEVITEGVNNLTLADSAAPGYQRNRIQVSNTKKPLFFYVNLAKRYMQQFNEVELSALGMAIATVVTVAEILKNNGFAVENRKFPDQRFLGSFSAVRDSNFKCSNVQKLTRKFCRNHNFDY